jgi:hypothetical protein
MRMKKIVIKVYSSLNYLIFKFIGMLIKMMKIKNSFYNREKRVQNKQGNWRNNIDSRCTSTTYNNENLLSFISVIKSNFNYF